jgi:hypothetical protein
MYRAALVLCGILVRVLAFPAKSVSTAVDPKMSLWLTILSRDHPLSSRMALGQPILF